MPVIKSIYWDFLITSYKLDHPNNLHQPHPAVRGGELCCKHIFIQMTKRNRANSEEKHTKSNAVFNYTECLTL